MISKIKYSEIVKNQTLDRWTSNVTETSRAAYHDPEFIESRLSQEEQVKHLFIFAGDNGLTDFELREQLRKQYQVIIPLSSCSARRNGCNKFYSKQYGYNVIIHTAGDYRINPKTNKSARVHKWRQ